MAQDQGYMVNLTSLPKQALIIFGEWLKMCVLGISSKNTTPFQSHQTDSIIFFGYNSAFDVVSSPVMIRFQKRSNLLHLKCKSQALMRFD